MSGQQRRADDQLAVPMFVVGCAFIAAGAVMAVLTDVSDKVTLTLMFIGALLIPTTRFLQAIRFWRRGNGGDPGAGPQ